MKTKIILSVVAGAALFLGCARGPTIPIEKYGGSRYVITNIEGSLEHSKNLQLKNKDTIFWITVLSFDRGDLKIGDTIR